VGAAAVLAVLVALAVLGSAVDGPWVVNLGSRVAITPPPPAVRSTSLPLEATRTVASSGAQNPSTLDLSPLIWIGIAVVLALAVRVARGLARRLRPDADASCPNRSPG
jgi:hypothetical protein